MCNVKKSTTILYIFKINGALLLITSMLKRPLHTLVLYKICHNKCNHDYKSFLRLLKFINQLSNPTSHYYQIIQINVQLVQSASGHGRRHLITVTID